jgi:hypothetical protein
MNVYVYIDAFNIAFDTYWYTIVYTHTCIYIHLEKDMYICIYRDMYTFMLQPTDRILYRLHEIARLDASFSSPVVNHNIEYTVSGKFDHRPTVHGHR